MSYSRGGKPPGTIKNQKQKKIKYVGAHANLGIYDPPDFTRGCEPPGFYPGNFVVLCPGVYTPGYMTLPLQGRIQKHIFIWQLTNQLNRTRFLLIQKTQNLS